ncbi:glycyl-tRNA ligase [Candidatus Magnetomorum sp. HK-1]|nr:glycyl-tRNA ligase [Candidatus Magnetomorum sp. HK-1]
MDKIVSLAKRRGFVYPSSEIYGGFSAVYDFGPYGTELAKNIREAWWQEMVNQHDNIVGLDSSIFMHPNVWEASGHIKGFSDPLSECKQCHSRLRVDHLLEDYGIFADEKMSEEKINELLINNIKKISCPNCGGKNLSKAKKFNLLVQSNLGNFTEDINKKPVYLRGETCQGIYINFKNVLASTRIKIPFGIAQIGKAFRNEITARQFIFRKREFEQMEMQMFVHPDQAMDEYNEWREKRWQYYIDLGIKKENLRWHQHENLVFYAKEAWDIEYKFPFGFKELEGIHSRGDYDLKQHAMYSGQKMDYRDPKTNEVYIPHVVETSGGVERTFLAILTDAYTKEELADRKSRIVLKLPIQLAPIKIAVFPLLKNKSQLIEKARAIYDDLKMKYMCEFDDNGNVGKRYRRQDEIGTPYCVTVDFDTLDNNDVTVRNRDTMKQARVGINKLQDFFSKIYKS